MTTALQAPDRDQAPPTRTAGPVPVAITPRPIGETEVRIIDVSTVSEAAGCNCNASDDNPY